MLSDSVNLVAIGDCNTSGTREQGDSFNVPALLVERLEKAGHSCQLTNLGRTMSTSREGVQLALDHGEPADLLLLNFGLVDAWVTSLPKLYVSYYPDSKWKKLGRKLLKSLKKRLRGAAKRKLIPVGHVVEKAEYQRNLALIVETLRARNPGLRVMFWGAAPTWADPDRNVFLAEYDQVIQGLQLERDCYVDTRTLLEPHPVDAMYSDNVHLSRAGAELVADAMADQLLKRRQ